MNNEILGQNGMVWFMGVVENRVDPLKVGRVQVRCFGYHTENKELIPTATLPWASIMLPVTETAMNGLGKTPSGLVEGTWVVGFFRDGKNAQDPVIMGCVPGRPIETPNTEIGFNDSAGVYPKADHINEPDINRLARNDSALSIDKTIVKTKKDNLVTRIPIALEKNTEKNTWDEPTTPYAAQYPFNHVAETESGHIVEYDDTPNAERIHEYHKSGTFREIYPDGSIVQKIKGSRYTIIAVDEKVYVIGDCDLTVAGNTNIYTNGNVNFETLGDVKFNTTGSTNIVSTKNINITTENKVVITSSSDTTINSTGKTLINATQNIQMSSDNQIRLNAADDIIITSGTKVRLNGPTQHARVK